MHVEVEKRLKIYDSESRAVEGYAHCADEVMMLNRYGQTRTGTIHHINNDGFEYRDNQGGKHYMRLDYLEAIKVI